MNFTSPAVSVIIPNYNHELYLKSRIESVLGQTFSDYEVIVLDDCSKDGSRKLIIDYANKDNRIKYFFNDKNSGSVFKQWAKGLSLAKGRYIWIAESDDFAELDFLSTLVPILEQNSSLSFVFSNSLVVNEEGFAKEAISELKKKIFGSTHWDYNYISDGKQELQNYLSMQCTVNNASAVLFRRSSIEAVGGVDVSFKYAGDWAMYIKLSAVGGIAYIAKCLNNYREHEVNTSKRSFADGSQLFERQKCFALTYASNILDKVSRDKMLYYAGIEFNQLVEFVLQTNNQPARMAQMVAAISSISFSYYTRVQYTIIRNTKLWKVMRMLRDKIKK